MEESVVKYLIYLQKSTKSTTRLNREHNLFSYEGTERTEPCKTDVQGHLKKIVSLTFWSKGCHQEVKDGSEGALQQRHPVPPGFAELSDWVHPYRVIIVSYKHTNKSTTLFVHSQQPLFSSLLPHPCTLDPLPHPPSSAVLFHSSLCTVRWRVEERETGWVGWGWR